LLCNHTHAYDKNRIKAITEQLNIQNFELADENNLPNTDLLAWVIVIKTEEEANGNRTYEIYNLITDTTGKILGKDKDVNTYEDELTSAKIDTANYRLNDSTRAFGVRLTTKRVSRPFGSSDEKISLFVFQDNGLKKVLGNVQVYAHNRYEMFEDCTGSWNETKAVLIISDKKTNNYNNIIVKTQNTYHGLKGKKKKVPSVKKTLLKKTHQNYLNLTGLFMHKKVDSIKRSLGKRNAIQATPALMACGEMNFFVEINE